MCLCFCLPGLRVGSSRCLNFSRMAQVQDAVFSYCAWTYLFVCRLQSSLLNKAEVQEQEMSEPFFGLAFDLDLWQTGLGATNEEGGKHSILFQWHLPPDLVSRKRISTNICFRTKLTSMKIHVLILLLTKGARLTIGRKDCRILLRP